MARKLSMRLREQTPLKFGSQEAQEPICGSRASQRLDTKPVPKHLNAELHHEALEGEKQI
jgi:hypothetical protein